MNRRAKKHLSLVHDKRHEAVCADLLSHALESAMVADLVIRELAPEDFAEKERPIFEALREIFPVRGSVDITEIGQRVSWSSLATFQERRRCVQVDGVFGALRDIRKAKAEAEAQRLIRTGDHAAAAALLSKIGQAAGCSAEAPGRVTDAAIKSFLSLSEKNKERGFLGPKTGLWPLDNLTLGMAPGSLWAIGGETSIGKSTLLSQILVEGLLQGAAVAVFSLEMPIPWVLARLVGAYLRKNPRAIFMGKLDETGKTELQGTLEIFKESPLYVYRDHTELSDICATAREVRAAHAGADLICAVDFIQNVRARGSVAQVERMATAAVEFQRLAGETNATMLICSQLSNEGVREKGGGVLSYRYAAELAHAADVALELVRKKEGNAVDLLVRKERSGALGTIPLRWTGQFSRFEVDTETPRERKERGGN